jgi:hypothetical protein
VVRIVVNHPEQLEFIIQTSPAPKVVPHSTDVSEDFIRNDQNSSDIRILKSVHDTDQSSKSTSTYYSLHCRMIKFVSNVEDTFSWITIGELWIQRQQINVVMDTVVESILGVEKSNVQ